MLIPVGLVREGLVDAVVEVLVVGEDDVAADVVELSRGEGSGVCCMGVGRMVRTYETLRGDVGRGKTAWNVAAVDNHP